MTINTNTSFLQDITDCVKLFISDDIEVLHTLFFEDGKHKDHVTINGKAYDYAFAYIQSDDQIVKKRMEKRYSKLSVFYALSDFFQKKLPWGSLTGIRPTRLFYELGEQAKSDFLDVFCVSESKTQLIEDILFQQNGLINDTENVADIYVSIPFCTSRCAYCSFLSSQIDKCGHLVDDYIKCLIMEITALKRIVKRKRYRTPCVYVGGGTPTSIDCNALERVLEHLKFSSQEFTVEAGRPDTITVDKLDIIMTAKANRISVNPQTFCDDTLKKIGRKHTVDEFLRSYALAKEYPFKINMDLIAGLPDENFFTFKNSLDAAIDLSPDNITVHTLALKRGAILKDETYHYDSAETMRMIDYSYFTLKQNKYFPYYLYRQKYVVESLENVGYSKSGSACKYNIDIMEENTSILAAGANAISKRVFLKEHRIERVANPKDVKTYIDKIDKIIEDKENLFS